MAAPSVPRAVSLDVDGDAEYPARQRSYNSRSRDDASWHENLHCLRLHKTLLGRVTAVVSHETSSGFAVEWPSTGQ